jgi:hypothetical protein
MNLLKRAELCINKVAAEKKQKEATDSANLPIL